MDTKTCTKCGETKVLDDFHKKTTSKDGHSGECKACVAARKAKRRQENPSAKALRRLAWESNPQTTKVCKGCGVEKSFDQFPPNKSMFSGCENTCNACKVAAAVEWRSQNLDKARANVRKCNKAHPARMRVATDQWRARNPERVKTASEAWNKAHPAQNNARNSRHRAKKLQATPAWANQFFIDEVYDLAQLRTEATGFQWDVDHIVPLNHKKVCGLHVEFNLRVIPATINQKKGNRHWPDMPQQGAHHG
jgi:hypothetical protein